MANFNDQHQIDNSLPHADTLTIALRAYQTALGTVAQASPIFQKQRDLVRLREGAIESLNEYSNKPKKRAAILTKLYDNLNNSTLLLSALNDLQKLLNAQPSFLAHADYNYIPPSLKTDLQSSIDACYHETEMLADALLSKPYTANSAKEMGLLTSTIEALHNLYKDPLSTPKLLTLTSIATSIPTPTPLWKRLVGVVLLATAAMTILITAPFVLAITQMSAALITLPFCIGFAALLGIGAGIGAVIGTKLALAPREHFFYKSSLPHNLSNAKQAAEAFQKFSLYQPAPSLNIPGQQPSRSLYRFFLPSIPLNFGISSQQPQQLNIEDEPGMTITAP